MPSSILNGIYYSDISPIASIDTTRHYMHNDVILHMA
jgi:hypothetical protein